MNGKTKRRQTPPNVIEIELEDGTRCRIDNATFIINEKSLEFKPKFVKKIPWQAQRHNQITLP